MPSSPRRKTALAKKPVTLHDIARHLGLSQRTVSQALNGRPDSTSKASETTRRRVEAAARELGYRPNRAARALRTGKTGLVAVLSFLGLQHYGSVRLHAALQEIRRKRLPPLIYHSSAASSEIHDACHAVVDAAVDGVLLLDPPPAFDTKSLDLLTASGRPVVALGGEHLPGISRYCFDRADGFRALAKHLAEEGCRSIRFMVAPLHAGREETRSFASAIRAGLAAGREGRQGVSCRITTVQYPDDAFAIDESPVAGLHVLHAPGYLGMRQLIAGGDLPDAVMCRSDTMAQGVLRACEEAGITVPGQIAVTGFDDEPASSAGWMPLTSVGLPLEEMIRPAVEELAGLVRGELQPRDHISLVRGKVVIRHSSRKKSQGA